MRQFLNLILSFAPWIAFLVLAGHSLIRLEIALIVSAVLVLVMAALKLHRGAILYSGYLFFGAAMVFVIGLKNLWFIEHLGILANGTLYAATLLGMMAGKPFTADYAKSEVSPERWETAGFVRSCYITTSVWSLIFLFNLLCSVVNFYDRSLPEWGFVMASYSSLFCGVLFTNVYSAVMRKRRACAQSSASPAPGIEVAPQCECGCGGQK